MVTDGDGDGDEVDGEYVKWLLKMLHWWYAAIKDFVKFDFKKIKANLWQSKLICDNHMKGQSEIAYLPKFADLYVKLKWISGIQSNCIHIELLIASLAQILTELLQFKVLTYL